MAPRTHIAVLGGGISGLSTAWYLAKTAPSNVKITLIEGTKRTGGWLYSDRVADPQYPNGKGSVLLERGPRSLRPQGVSGLNTLEMVSRNNLFLTGEELVASIVCCLFFSRERRREGQSLQWLIACSFLAKEGGGEGPIAFIACCFLVLLTD